MHLHECDNQGGSHGDQRHSSSAQWRRCSLVSGAQAADLPVKAKAVEYVRICTLYGAGFFYIPGTDTCIKLGGYLRADTTFNGGAHGAPAWNGDLGQQNRFRDDLAFPFAHGADGRYPHRHRIRRGSHLRPGRLPVPRTSEAPTTRGAVTRRLGAQQRAAEQRGWRLRRGRVSLHPVRRLHLRQVFLGLLRRHGTVFRATSTSNLLGGNNTDTGVNNIQYTARVRQRRVRQHRPR